MMNEQEFSHVFGDRIRKLRKAKSLSQDQLAEKINKSKDTISNIERGKFFPRLETAIEIAEALGIELYELFQIRTLSMKDKEKIKILDEIFNLLKDQPDEILYFTLAQTKQIVSLKDTFSEEPRK